MKLIRAFCFFTACIYCSLIWSDQDASLESRQQISENTSGKIEGSVTTSYKVAAAGGAIEGSEEEKKNSQKGVPDSTKKTEFPHEVYIALGPILAALIVAFINYTSMTTAKDQEITQLRASWIKDLMNALARLCAEVELIVRLVECESCAPEKGLNKDELKRIRGENKDHYKDMNEAFYIARMQLDPEKNKDILKQLGLLYAAFYNNSCANLHEIRAIQEILMERSQLLNEEIWSKIQSGDAKFRLLRNLIILVASLSLLLLVGVAFYVHFHLHWL